MRLTSRQLGLLLTAILGTFAAACEDGPNTVFEPFSGDVGEQNGFAGTPWTPPGSKGFEETGGTGDASGRARFCDEAQQTQLIEWMVSQPIIPNRSVGGIPLWAAQGGPVVAETLLGVPDTGDWNALGSDGYPVGPGKFCDPSEVYSNAYTWGPALEVVVLFNQDTHLIEQVWAGYAGEYLGDLAGTVTYDDASTIDVVLHTTEPIKLDSGAGPVELNSYPDWLAPQNLSAIYGMLQQNFFSSALDVPAGYNCLDARTCDIVYNDPDNPQTPQFTVILFNDNGVFLYVAPDGIVQEIDVAPVRRVRLEFDGQISFGSTGNVTLSYLAQSPEIVGCNFLVDSETTWGAFTTACLSPTEMNVLGYTTLLQRDESHVGFSNLDLGFLRTVSVNGVLENGERPDNADKLIYANITRSLNAEVVQYVPTDLAAAFKTRLEQAIQDATTVGGHPLDSFSLTIPAGLESTAQPIGELSYTTGTGDDIVDHSWIPEAVDEVMDAYAALSTGDKATVDAKVNDPVWLRQVFVDTVLDAFTFGASDLPTTYKTYETDSTRRWAIVTARFIEGGKPFQITGQYSLFYDALTSVQYTVGYGELDEMIYNLVEAQITNTTGYFELSMSQAENSNENPYCVGGTGIIVGSSDRRLNTLDVELVDPVSYAAHQIDNNVEVTSSALTVTGYARDTESGFLRQLDGATYEFVPADEVYLYGQETQVLFYVEANGEIGRIYQDNFKGSLELCEGLSISFGDDVRAAVDGFMMSEGLQAYQQCDLVFNYSENGNLLLEVASLQSKVAIGLTADRAVYAALWR